jgi:hypothetical protein
LKPYTTIISKWRNRDMPRLPQPGSDAGNWGTILNDFLTATHDTNGNLKAGVVTNSAIAAGAVSIGKLAVNNSPNAGQTLTFDGTGLSWSTPSGSGSVPDASTSTKGLVQLAGDLGGTSAAPTVPGLTSKANTSDVVTLAGSQTVTGAKNFTGGLQAGGSVVVTTNDARLTDVRTPADGSVSTVKVADNAITEPKLNAANTPASGQVLSYNGTNFTWVSQPTGTATDPTVGGDLTGTASNAQLVANAVNTAALADASVTEPKLAASNSPSTNQVLSWNGTALTWATPAAGGGGGTSSWNAVTRTTAYTAVSGDFVICNTSTSGFTVTLPAPTNGAYVTVKKATNNVNAVLVAPPSGNIDAGPSTSATISVNNYGQVADFMADGTTWHQVG